ncbi:MAG: DUF1489 domain-containing protein [Pseudomonadota bacterium]
MDQHINLVKLGVGADTIADLEAWQAQRLRRGEDLTHVTRMWPKRADELTAGGSLYWVIKGSVLCRQRILRLDEAMGHDGIRRCAIVLDHDIIRTAPAPRRPFQGWRYLTQADAPPDLSAKAQREEPLPAELERALSEMGLV